MGSSQEPGRETYRLEASDLTLTRESLSKIGDDGQTVSSVLLKDLHEAKVIGGVSWVALVFCGICFGLAGVLAVYTRWVGSRYVAAPALGVVGLLALIGGAFTRELACKTRYGEVRFALTDAGHDIDAFVVTLKRLQAEAAGLARR